MRLTLGILCSCSVAQFSFCFRGKAEYLKYDVVDGVVYSGGSPGSVYSRTAKHSLVECHGLKCLPVEANVDLVCCNRTQSHLPEHLPLEHLPETLPETILLHFGLRAFDAMKRGVVVGRDEVGESV